MTVKELIEKLKKCDPTLPVQVKNREEYAYSSVTWEHVDVFIDIEDIYDLENGKIIIELDR